MRRNIISWGFTGAVALFLAVAPGFADTRRVAALGDSLTHGYGLPIDQGFVPQLQGWLDAQGTDAQVINFGVSGDTTQGGLSRVAWTLTPDIDAMILALGGNDLLRGIDPATSRANLRGILEVAVAQDVDVMLIGMQAPGNYGPAFKTAFDGMYPDLAAEFDIPLYPSFFAAFDGQADVPAQLGDAIQSDGIHPSALGVQKIVAHMGPFVADWLDGSD